jgi:hypothetical protein
MRVHRIFHETGADPENSAAAHRPTRDKGRCRSRMGVTDVL